MGFFSKIFKGITNLIGDVIGFLVGADFDDQSQAQGVLLNKSSNIANIPIIYGRRRVGGTRVFLSTGGDKNQYLYMALALCEGEIQAIDDVYINDTLSTDSKFSGLVWIQKKLGTDGQTASTLLRGTSGPNVAPADTWGSDHRLRGVAYLAIVLKYDQDVFGSIPDIQCVVRGLKVHDPRTGTTSYSTNPALCLRDYLVNDRYGKGLLAVQLNDTAFSAAANVCDTTVTEYSGSSSTIKLLECNAVLDTGKNLFDNVKILLQGMRGLMPFQDGKYSLLIDAAAPAGTPFRLDDSNITSAIQVTASGKNKKFNRVRAKFVNPEANWQEDSVDWPPNDSTYSTFLSEDNNEELLRNVTLNTITNYYSARDLARIICRASREHQLTVEVTALPEALSIAVGDVVELEHDSLGWSGAAIQDFRVLAMGLQENGEVKLTLQEYSNVYTWQEGPEEDDSPNTTIPDPFDVEPVDYVNLSQGVDVAADGSEIPYLDIAFGASPDAFVVEYLINISPSQLDPSEVRMSTAQLTNAQINGTTAINYLIQPALVDTYTVTVRAVNDAGVRSSAVSQSITITGDNTPPSAITLNPLEAGIKTVFLSWTNPNDDDFAFVRIQRRITNTGSYATVTDVFGTPSTASGFVDAGLADAQSYQYRAYAYDWSRNASAVSNVRTITTSDAPLDITDLESRSANGYVYYQVETASTVTSLTKPSATSYDWDTGLFTGLSSFWDEDPPETNPVAGAGVSVKWWACRYFITESEYNGLQSIVFSTPFSSFLFEGLVTFSNLDTELGNASSNLVTTIDGGLIKTGEIDLANQQGMNIHQGKSSYTSTTSGFWLGNDSGPKFGIGTSNNYLRFDGSGVTARGITIEDGNGNTLLSTSGFDGIDLGANLIPNGGFNEGSANWSDAGTGAASFNSSLGRCFLSDGEAVQNDAYFYVVDQEPLYIAIQAFSNTYMNATVVWYKADGSFTSSTVGYGASDQFSPTQNNTSTTMYVAAVTPPTATTPYVKARIRVKNNGNQNNLVTVHSVMVSRTPPVIDPSYTSTFIRDASIGEAQIGTLYVTDLTGDVNTITSFGSSANIQTGPSYNYPPATSDFREMFTVICEQNSQAAIYHEATISGCFSAKYATDTAHIKLEWRARTTRTQTTNSWTGWTTVNTLRARSAGGGSAWMDLPFAGGTGTTHNVDVQFRVSVAMANDNDNGTTNQSRSSTMRYSGHTIGVV